MWIAARVGRTTVWARTVHDSWLRRACNEAPASAWGAGQPPATSTACAWTFIAFNRALRPLMPEVRPR
jgi:hypothetical protein